MTEHITTEGIVECVQICEQYIQNAGEHYNAILNNCVEFCGQNFGVVGNLQRGLEIGLVVLVILLVIIGFILGFTKLKGKEDEDDYSGPDFEYTSSLNSNRKK